MNNARRYWLLGAGAAALAILLALGFLRRSVGVDVEAASRGTLRVTVDEDGRTRIRDRYIVSTPVAGQLRRIELKPGDPVTAGETLITVLEPADPELLDARTRSQLEARLHAAEAQVQSTAAESARAHAGEVLAASELERAQSLAASGAISRQDLDRAQEAARAAAELTAAAGYRRQVAAFELDQARAALSHGTHDDDAAAGAIPIRAPVSGRVLRVFREDAAVVPAMTQLIEVGDPTDLEVEVDVLSSDAVRVAPGARCYFDYWGGEVPLEGRVRVVEPAGFLKISALGVEEQRVNIIADLVTPVERRPRLGDAYRVEARIVVWEATDVLTVPVGALFRSGSDWAVFAVRDGRARLTRVVIGHGDGRRMEIRSGLASGDRVVVYASDRVADGVRLAPRAAR